MQRFDLHCTPADHRHLVAILTVTTCTEGCRAEYVVRSPADSLEAIAAKCGAPIADLGTANRANTRTIAYGDRLVLPNCVPPAPLSCQNCPSPYPVTYGESLATIATKWYATLHFFVSRGREGG
jgi:hypothetical protein